MTATPLPSAAIREQLTRDEARQRSALIDAVTTTVVLDLTQDAATFRSTTTLTFTCRQPGTTFLDLTAQRVHRATLDGSPLDQSLIEPTRILLPDLAAGHHEVVIDADMHYRHEGRGLHRFVDPTDQAVYLHSQFEPFDAHLVYACFDQPDLRAVFTLTVNAPRDWVVVSNSPSLSTEHSGQVTEWRFAATPAISPYITAVVAGPYVHVEDQYVRDDGSTVPLRWFVRRSLAQHLDADELFTVTKQGLDFFEEVFAQHYPFAKYDQLLVPEFLFGAMENPGCVTFSETYVFRSEVTDARRERRAETILHEMAHMWFGDLVTMRWWDDLWLNESFATFMAQLAQVSATRWSGAWVTFHDSLKTWAKSQDQLPSTHPIADEMPDVESVHQNFDGITYAKGASVLRQLVAWVGQEEFLAGCRRYFSQHAWGNTELTDFLAALEQASGRDLSTWSHEWLRTTGLNELSVHADLSADRTYQSVTIRQESVRPSWAGEAGTAAYEPVLRRHRIAVGLYDRTATGTLTRRRRIELDVADEHTDIAALVGEPEAAMVLVNDDDLTYAKIVLDTSTQASLVDDLRHVDDPLARVLLWNATWDMVRDAKIDVGTFLPIFTNNAAHEPQVGVIERLAARALGAVERYGSIAHRQSRLRQLADHGFARLQVSDLDADHRLAWARHWINTTDRDPQHLAQLHDLLDATLVVPGLVVDTDLRWQIVAALTRSGSADPSLIDEELQRDPTDQGQQHAIAAHAAVPTAHAKQHAWRRMLDDTQLSHTLCRHLWAGFATYGQTELLEDYTDAYFDELANVWDHRSLEWAIGFTNALYPHWADVDHVLARTRHRLDATDHRAERRALLEQRDQLVRSAAARTLDTSKG